MKRWFRVDDATQDQTVLIKAESSDEATRLYLEDYAPDLYVEEAEPAVVEDWLRDCEEWDKIDQSHIWFR